MEPIVFLKLLLIPSAVGALAYLLCRKFRPAPLLFLPVWLYYFLCLITPRPSPDGFALIFVGALVSVLGAWAHRKSVNFEEKVRRSYYLVLNATILSALFGLFVAAVLNEVPSLPFWVNLYGAPVEGTMYMLFLSVTPSMTPFLILAWQSMKLRTGLDVHAEDQ